MWQGNILVWNCRGIVNQETQRALIDMVQAKRPQLIFLSETLASQKLIDTITGRVGFVGNFCFPKQKDSRGLALLWGPEVHVDFRSSSPHHIDVEVCESGALASWRFTGIYGVASRTERNQTWSMIETLAQQNCSLPWLMAGDFNEIMSHVDKSGGVPRAATAMNKFGQTMVLAGLLDMGFVGCKYTWSDKFTKERLDRGFQTVQWRDLYPFSRVITLPPSDSDHNTLLVEVRLEKTVLRRHTRKFRFEEGWYGNEQCSEIIHRNWVIPLTGNVLQQLGTKIKNAGCQLMQWHRVEFQKHKTELHEIQGKLFDIMKQPYSPMQYEVQQNLHVRQSQLLSLQEKYWKQRSRALWLKEGDRNSAFFHRKASNRKCRNTIKGLQDENGEWHNDPRTIKHMLLEYYQKVFANEGVDDDAISTVFRATPMKVTAFMNADLTLPYSDEEIKVALFQMHPSKSPSPDGMSPFFFQKYWHIVGLDVCLAIRNFLEKGESWDESNFTHICLIPKIKNPTDASHFRPIALCNVIYRICSKVVANRLKRWLPEIISPLQSAYVPGRLISDNTLVATEVAHFMHKLRTQAEGFFSLKLDISKAYDRLEWSLFLQAILTKLGFASNWINMIMRCVTSVSYAILVNGEATTTVKPTRGIRQGDPLSPYLFILCAEGLSALISQVVHSGSIHGLQMCPQAPTLHHLFFADDSLLFGSATPEECSAFREILNTYERASGQKVNFQKSSVVFSNNVTVATQTALASILEVNCVKEHDRYLGLPLRVGRSKTERFQYIKEKLSKKLVSWKSKILSCAGKEILIKAIAQTMPLYAMNCYLLPKGLCDDIHQLCASFFWGDTDEKKHIHWRSWENLCLTKHEGGMGFKNLYAYNLAMLAKQGWRMITNSQSLIAQIFKARYFPNCSFWDAELEAPSFSWRSILEGRPVLKAGTKWRIGDGSQVHIWNDAWIPNCPSYLIHRPENTTFERVSDLIDHQNQTWNFASVSTLFNPNVVHHILSIPLPRNSMHDQLIWSYEKRGFFTVKSAYWAAREQVLGSALATTSSGNPFKELWRRLWRTKVPGKVHICVGRACNNLLPTRERLLSKGYKGDVHCLLCNHVCESTAHLFCKCPIALDILSAAPFSLQHTLLPNLNFKEWMLEQSLHLKAEVFEKLVMIIWGLWRNRNAKLWENKMQTVTDIKLGCFTWLEDFQKASKPALQTAMQTTKIWKPASALKLNVDGAYLEHRIKGGVGGILRDSMGHFTSAYLKPVNYVSSAFHVELLAIREGIDLVQKFKLQQVVIETDCLLAVNAIHSSAPNLSSLGSLINDIQAAMRCNPGVQITFASRSCNRIAHRLANIAYESAQGVVWSDSIPDCIIDLVQQECTPF
ncbi:uncharacterized protein LOC133744394 [Rosa rugosa]|uniref:uncharacterized protein LOC133744394 n=1 Tax=Rosa rugosa TaxID=74645 RepID=UPI002B405F2B|nr:uncharacterized protein LOC133744394 [Rosa rugosa]